MMDNGSDYKDGIIEGLLTAESVVRSYLITARKDDEVARATHASISNTLLDFIAADLQRLLYGIEHNTNRTTNSNSLLPVGKSESPPGHTLSVYLGRTQCREEKCLGSECYASPGIEERRPGYNDSCPNNVITGRFSRVQK